MDLFLHILILKIPVIRREIRDQLIGIMPDIIQIHVVFLVPRIPQRNGRQLDLQFLFQPPVFILRGIDVLIGIGIRGENDTIAARRQYRSSRQKTHKNHQYQNQHHDPEQHPHGILSIDEKGPDFGFHTLLPFLFHRSLPINLRTMPSNRRPLLHPSTGISQHIPSRVRCLHRIILIPFFG